MPTPRSGINDETVTTRYGFMEPVVPPDSGRSWSALSIPCSGCGAGAGEHCHGARFCADRMARLREMIGSGEMGGDVIPPRVRDCPDCHKRRNQTGSKWLACSDPAHRCVSMDRGSRCSGAVVTGTTRCPKHHAV